MTLPGAAIGKCVDDWLMIDEIRDGAGDVELRAINQQQYPITYSVRVRSDEHPGHRGKVVRGSLDGGESESVLTVPDAEDVRLSCRWTIGDNNAVHDDDHVYLLPYARGKSYRVLQGFGSGFSHRGRAAKFDRSCNRIAHQGCRTRRHCEQDRSKKRLQDLRRPKDHETAALSVSILSVLSQVRSGSLLPKCP